MQRLGFFQHLFRVGTLAALLAASTLAARADEGGVSFWIPGFFGSLAAVPATPGWSATEIFYHDSVSASGNVALARAAQIGQIPVNLTATVNANVNANVNLGFVAATYVFATPVLGGQASASMLAAYGNNSTSLAGSFAAMLSKVSLENTTPQPNVSSGRLRSNTVMSCAASRSFMLIAK